MRLINPKEVMRADRYATEHLNTDILDMIDSAAEHLAENCLQYSRVTVVCGGGNNGADGFCAAIKLLTYGVKVKVWTASAGGSGSLNENCLHYIKLLYEKGVSTEGIDLLAENCNFSELCNDVKASDAVLDCILGTGFSSEKKRDSDMCLRNLISVINENAKIIISADIPSGIDGSNGCCFDTAIEADKTITFGYAKPGHYILPGKKHCGELDVVSVRVPEEAYKKSIQCDIEVFTSGDASISRLLKERNKYCYKGSFGRVLIIAGSEGMTGAAILAARACIKSGAGICYLAAPRAILPVYEQTLPEIVKIPLGDKNSSYVGEEFSEELVSLSSEMDAVLIGPGLGRRETTKAAVCEIIRKSSCGRFIIDADALRFISTLDDFKEHTAEKQVILTPHEGELEALIGKKIHEAGGRLEAARLCRKRYGAVVVCKGNDTIIYNDTDNYTVNATGNSGMATAGSGDVLSGIISAMAVSSDNAYDAARLGVYLHGLAGDKAAEKLTEYCVTAGELINYLNEAFLFLVKNRD